MSKMAAANTPSSNTHEDDSVEGNDRLHERLQDDTGLIRRHGENIETSYEFVKSTDHNTPNSSITKNLNTTYSSIYHQKICLSNDGNQIKEYLSKNEGSGGANPKIREKNNLSTNVLDASDKDDKNRLEGAGAASNSENKSDATDDSNINSAFECNICLNVAREAVISMCGHLFCWPCLEPWLETSPSRQICPVCKADIGEDNVVPLYGRDDANPKDPREKTTGGSTLEGFEEGGNDCQIPLGIDADSFLFLAGNFILAGTEETLWHKMFLWVAFLFIVHY